MYRFLSGDDIPLIHTSSRPAHGVAAAFAATMIALWLPFLISLAAAAAFYQLALKPLYRTKNLAHPNMAEKKSRIDSFPPNAGEIFNLGESSADTFVEEMAEKGHFYSDVR